MQNFWSHSGRGGRYITPLSEQAHALVKTPTVAIVESVTLLRATN